MKTKHYNRIALLMGLLTTAPAFAVGTSSCDTIAKACKGAGYQVYAGKAKALESGADLWNDCYCPIVQGTVAPANAKFKLSTTSLTRAIAQCKQQPRYPAKCQ